MTKARDLANVVSAGGGLSTGQVDITEQGDLRLQDTTGGEYVALQAPGTVSSSFTLTLPAADGTSGQVLQTNGSGALSFATPAAGGGLQSMQVFTSSGTWTKPSGITKVRVTVIGGGGGGSRHGSGNNGGGGAGAAVKLIDVSAVSTVSVTVGAGGSGGTSASPNGGNGGSSSFGAYCSANGGTGGASGSNDFGVGGTATGGDYNIRGQNGSGSVSNNSPLPTGGTGGSSLLGLAGPMTQPGITGGGAEGTGYGAGGSGANENYDTSAGSGSGGIVIVEEFK
jgi:hypothetical protein